MTEPGEHVRDRSRDEAGDLIPNGLPSAEPVGYLAP